jgi:molecular chaperone DnaK (HSP70)
MRRFNKAGRQGGRALVLDAEYASREAIDSADRPGILRCLSSLPHDFHNHPLVPLPIKLGIKDPLPSPQIEFAAGKGTGKEQQIRIQASGGLSEADIQKMFKDAEAHAEEDKKRRAQVEAKYHAEVLVHSSTARRSVRASAV